MAMDSKTLKNIGKKVFKKLGEEQIVKDGISARLMPYRFTKGASLALIGTSAGISAFKTGKEAYSAKNLGHIEISENLDRLISIDGSGFFDRFDELAQGDPVLEKDIVKHTFDEPNQAATYNNLVFALHNRRNG